MPQPHLSRRQVLASAAGLLVFSRLPRPSSAAAHTDLRAQLRRDAEAIRDLGIAGVLAEVWTPAGRLAVRSGVADRATGRPVPFGASYRIGSSTKTFTAVALLQLVGEDKVGLDDSVERHLPGLVSEKITVRHLLRHQSGLPDWDDLVRKLFATPEDYERNKLRSFTPEELVAAALAHPPRFEPGTQWQYVNTNYLLAGMIIAKVTGRSWAQEIRDRILNPLRLRHTFVATDPYLPRPHAHAYARWEPDGPWIDTTVTGLHGYGAGGLISTTADLNRFWRGLIGRRLLRPDLLAQMQDTVPVEGFPLPGLRNGLGVFQLPLSDGGMYWRHGGSMIGSLTMDGATPDGRRSVAVLTTSRAHLDRDFETRQNAATNTLIDHALTA